MKACNVPRTLHSYVTAAQMKEEVLWFGFFSSRPQLSINESESMGMAFLYGWYYIFENFTLITILFKWILSSIFSWGNWRVLSFNGGKNVNVSRNERSERLKNNLETGT